jgi:hypothetical protein
MMMHEPTTSEVTENNQPFTRAELIRVEFAALAFQPERYGFSRLLCAPGTVGQSPTQADQGAANLARTCSFTWSRTRNRASPLSS